MMRFLKRWLENTRGAALIEFALVVPFMLVFLFGAIEFARYVLIIQKVEKSAYVLTDLVGQYDPPTAAGKQGEISRNALDVEVFPLFNKLMAPYGTPNLEMVVFTSFVHKGTGPNIGKNYIQWQRYSPVGSLATDVQSIVTNAVPANIGHQPGTACQTTNLDGNISTMINQGGTDGAMPDEDILVGEVFFRYQPILGQLLNNTSSATSLTSPFSLSARTITRRVWLHPRQENLLALPPQTPTTGSAKTDVCP